MKLSEIASACGGTASGETDIEITGIAPLSHARSTDISFADNDRILSNASSSQAGAFIIRRDSDVSIDRPCVRVDNPRVAFAKLLPIFHPPRQYPAGIHPTAVISEDAIIDESCHIGPYCVIEAGAVIQKGTTLLSGVHVGQGSLIGSHCRIYPRVTIYDRISIGHNVIIHAGSVLGSDGFGFIFDQDHHRKVHQVGTILVEDDVEIGANVTIDRATMGVTRIGRGTKIDNLVQIGHNVEIGPYSIIVAQVGIAGSATVGKYAVIAGQAGISGHIKVGDKVTIGPQSGIVSDVSDGARVMGTPAMDHMKWKRVSILLQKLPELVRKLRI